MVQPVVVRSGYYNSSNEQVGSETDTVGYMDRLAFVNLTGYQETYMEVPDLPKITVNGDYDLGQDTTLASSIRATQVIFSLQDNTSYKEWPSIENNELYKFSEYNGEPSGGKQVKALSTITFPKQ